MPDPNPMARTTARPARRTAGLNGADRALWRSFLELAGVVPLPGRADPAIPPSPAAPTPPAAEIASPGPAPAPARPRPQPPRTPELTVGDAPPGIDGRRWRDLRRGRTRPERTLDLHGRTVAEAHGAVRGFLAAARDDGLRCVAIVTGRGPLPEGGVLKRELPHWLNAPDLRPFVLGVAYSHRSNQGAVNVLLRRARG